MDKLTIVKLGGKVIDNPVELSEVLEAFTKIEGRKLLVHGGGSLATKMEKSMGLTPKMVEGRRVTNKESLDVVTMVYAGLINKNIVAEVQRFGCNGLGLSGADGDSIRTIRRDPMPIDFGFVGDVKAVNAPLLNSFLNLGLVPVISAITHDGQGQLLNTNADTMAAEIAIALAQTNNVELLLAFEKAGVLDSSGKTISEIDKPMFNQLREEKVIIDGMIPKLTNAFSAIEGGVRTVKLVSSEFLLNPQGPFTEIIAE